LRRPKVTEEVILTFTFVRTGLGNLVTKAVRDETGQGLTEYALILFFIAVVAIAALTFLGSDISSILSQVANSL
jgi:pilus assembly protein Flp/PilA